jgi:hypothetical protein
MLNHRHPSPYERKILGMLLVDVGAVEILRVIGQHVATEHPDATDGDELRSRIFRIAKDIDAIHCPYAR